MRNCAPLAVVAVLMAGCATTEYGPVGGKPVAIYSYREIQDDTGRYTLTIIGSSAGKPQVVQTMWDRRARELCGNDQYRKNVYKAERPTETYSYYGGRPGGYVMEGYLECGAEHTATPVSSTDAP